MVCAKSSIATSQALSFILEANRRRALSHAFVHGFRYVERE
jgi:hypothetical protein